MGAQRRVINNFLWLAVRAAGGNEIQAYIPLEMRTKVFWAWELR